MVQCRKPPARGHDDGLTRAVGVRSIVLLLQLGQKLPAQLKQKYDAADSDRDRETIVMAARWGLAALDHDEEVVTL